MQVGEGKAVGCPWLPFQTRRLEVGGEEKRRAGWGEAQVEKRSLLGACRGCRHPESCLVVQRERGRAQGSPHLVAELPGILFQSLGGEDPKPHHSASHTCAGNPPGASPRAWKHFPTGGRSTGSACPSLRGLPFPHTLTSRPQPPAMAHPALTRTPQPPPPPPPVSCPEGARCLRGGSNSGLAGALPAASLQARRAGGPLWRTCRSWQLWAPEPLLGRGSVLGRGAGCPLLQHVARATGMWVQTAGVAKAPNFTARETEASGDLAGAPQLVSAELGLRPSCPPSGARLLHQPTAEPSAWGPRDNQVPDWVYELLGQFSVFVFCFIFKESEGAL